MARDRLLPLHPGEVLQEEFLKPLGLSQNQLAVDLGVPARRINEVVAGKRGITADMALRLVRYFGMSPQFWLGLQLDYELDVAMDKSANRIEQEVRVRELAERVGRDIKNVSQDLAFLSRLGLVEMKETRRGVPQAPTLPYDEIDLNLRIRL